MFKFFKRIWSILSLKCPRCQQESMFVNKNPFSFFQIFEMHEHCSNEKCKENFMPEVGFYFGAMFVSYGLTCFIVFSLLGVSLLLYGSISRTFLYLSLALVVFLWAYLFRISRTIWLTISTFFDEEVFNF